MSTKKTGKGQNRLENLENKELEQQVADGAQDANAVQPVVDGTKESDNQNGGVMDPSAQVAEVLSGPHSDLESKLLEFPVDNIKIGEFKKEVSEEELTQIVEHVRTGYGISNRTALNAVCELIRRGGAAKGTPANYSVEVFCPDEKVPAVVVKKDVERAVELICKNKRTLRNLAQTLAPLIVRTGLKRYMINPTLDVSGDLAKKINNRLLVRKEKPLSDFEKIGCASYAQCIPDLDKMCASDRLAHLLAEDLELRSNKGANTNKGFGSRKETPGKGKTKTSNSNNKGGNSNNKGGNKKGAKGGTKKK